MINDDARMKIKEKEMAKYFKNLRKQAEKRLRDKPDDVSDHNLDDAQQLIHELEVHQIELEMQNEELRSTQEDLVESRDRYHELYDFAPVGYFMLGEKSLIRQVNLTGADLLGSPRSQLIDAKLTDFISADYQDDFYLHCKRIFKSRTYQACDLKMKKQDGTLFDARLNSIAVKDKIAASRQLRTAVSDITEMVQAKKVLQESEEKFRLMFNQMVSASALYEVIFNQSGRPVDYRYLEVNAAFEHITGKKRNEVIGKTLLEVFPGTESYWLKILDEVAQTGQPQEVENIHRGLAKYFYVSGYRPVEGQVAVTFIDITDRRENEKASQRAHENLEKSVEERTAELAKSNLSLAREITERRRLSYRLLNAQENERRRIALEIHDELGQDLSVLKLQFDFLKRQLSESQIALEDHIEGISADLSKTIEKVRRISHTLIPSVLIDLGLSPALRWQIQSLAKFFKVEITSNDMELENFFSIEQQIAIYRIFQEIFTNIRKHAQAKKVSIKIGRDGSRIFFKIEDNGIGFEMERIKTKSAAESGLGLPAMEERVKMLDGNFAVFSRVGTGTKIAFEIPIADAPEQPALKDGDETHAPLSDYPGR